MDRLYATEGDRRRRDASPARGIGRVLIPALALGFLVSSAHATTLIGLSFDEVVAKAEEIVIGTVIEQRSEYSEDGKNIYTYVSFAVEDIIEGEPPKDGTLTLRFSGGTVGEQRSLYLGMPQFEPGDRVVLFTHQNGKAMCPIVGWCQGLFAVAREGKDTVIRDHCSGNRIVGYDAEGNLQRANLPQQNSGRLASPGVAEDGGDPGTLVVNTHDSSPSMTLYDFVTQIREIRDRTGFQPEGLPKSANSWIPVNAGDPDAFLKRAEKAIAAPGMDDAWIPRPVESEPALKEEN